jgi:hypothetical protein
MGDSPDGDLSNLTFDQVKQLDESSWRLWTYMQLRGIDKKLGWIVKILAALVAAVFGLKLV